MSVRRMAGRPRPFGLPQLLALLATIAVGVHGYGLYRPSGPPALIWFPYADKVQHLIGFAVPVALILLALRRRGSLDRAAAVRSRAVPVVVGLFVLHGVVSELAQHYFYTWRTGDPLDVLADWAGVLLGWGMVALLARDRRPQDQRRLDTVPAQVPR